MKTKVTGMLVVVVGLSVSLGVQAAEPLAKLITLKNTVLVNTGKHYASAHSGQALEKGHRVLTLEDASATVHYQNGCQLELGPNSLLALESEAQCLHGGPVIGPAQPGSALGAAQASETGGAWAAASPDEVQAAVLPAFAPFVGVAAAGTGMAATVAGALATDDSDNQQLSPE